MSIRRACSVLRIDRSLYVYKSKRGGQADLKQRIKEICDSMLALVSGLESGEVWQVRLIFDPANCASCKPTSSMRFYALNEAPAIVVTFEEGAPSTDVDKATG